MDWSKTKTILIVALLLTNLMLLITFFIEQSRFEVESDNNLKDVMKLYENKGVTIRQKELDFPETIKSVNIEFKTIPVEVVDSIFGSNYEYDGNQYLSGDQRILLNDTELIYSVGHHQTRVTQDLLTALINAVEIKSEETIKIYKDIAQDFLDKADLVGNFDMIEAYELGDYTLLKGHQIHEGIILAESKSNFWFYKGELVGFRRENWTNISSTAGSKYDIISVDRVLYGILPKLSSTDEIESLSIVYKLNDESLLVKDLVMGEALPYYRLVTSHGNEYHIRAVINN